VAKYQIFSAIYSMGPGHFKSKDHNYIHMVPHQEDITGVRQYCLLLINMHSSLKHPIHSRALWDALSFGVVVNKDLHKLEDVKWTYRCRLKMYYQPFQVLSVCYGELPALVHLIVESAASRHIM